MIVKPCLSILALFALFVLRYCLVSAYSQTELLQRTSPFAESFLCSKTGLVSHLKIVCVESVPRCVHREVFLDFIQNGDEKQWAQSRPLREPDFNFERGAAALCCFNASGSVFTHILNDCVSRVPFSYASKITSDLLVQCHRFFPSQERHLGRRNRVG